MRRPNDVVKEAWGGVVPIPEAADKQVTMVQPIVPGMITDHSQNEGLMAADYPHPISDPGRSRLKGDKSEQQLPITLDEEDLSHKSCRCCRRIFWRVVYQESVPRSNLPLTLFRRLPQIVCAGCCMASFLLVGVILLVSANGVNELKIKYSHTDAQLHFDTNIDMKGPVLLWYELPNLKLNRKKVVASKDKSIWGYPTLPGSIYQCDDADSLNEVTWRRSSQPFQAMLIAPGENKYRPCGLAGIAMFTDSFAIYTEAGGLVALDLTDIALSTDKRLYEDNSDFKSVTGQPYDFTLDGTPSWLTKAWLERFKVWSRTPASPKVRQLDGRIREGLPAGRYRMDFTVNDPIFEVQWDVPEKLIVLSESHTLGSAGAQSVLGVFCIVIAVFEMLFCIAVMLAPALVQFGIAPDHTTAPPSPHQVETAPLSHSQTKEDSNISVHTMD